jgi:hypothetical protein
VKIAGVTVGACAPAARKHHVSRRRQSVPSRVSFSEAASFGTHPTRSALTCGNLLAPAQRTTTVQPGFRTPAAWEHVVASGSSVYGEKNRRGIHKNSTQKTRQNTLFLHALARPKMRGEARPETAGFIGHTVFSDLVPLNNICAKRRGRVGWPRFLTQDSHPQVALSPRFPPSFTAARSRCNPGLRLRALPPR